MRTLDIPQANSIARLLTALAALGEETATAAQIAAVLGGLDARHGDYYLHALRILGLADYAGGVALRTTSGAQLAVLSPEEQRAQLARIVAATPPMQQVLELVDGQPTGVTQGDVTALLLGLAPRARPRPSGGRSACWPGCTTFSSPRPSVDAGGGLPSSTWRSRTRRSSRGWPRAGSRPRRCGRGAALE